MKREDFEILVGEPSIKVSENFWLHEMACPCCGMYYRNETLLEMLEIARAKAGIPFHPNSWFRCPKHNQFVGGSKNSEHCHGNAVDLRVVNSTAGYLIMGALFYAEFPRIEYHPVYYHAGVGADKPQLVLFPNPKILTTAA